MADDVDMTGERMDAEEARRRKLFKLEVIPSGTGVCWLDGCEEVPNKGGRWCSAEHRDRWQKEGGSPK